MPFILEYFKRNPLYGAKKRHRLALLPLYITLKKAKIKAHLADKHSLLFKQKI